MLTSKKRPRDDSTHTEKIKETDCSTSDPILTHDPWIDLHQGSFVGYWRNALGAETHHLLLERLLTQVAWQQRDVNIMGKRIPQPRFVAYFALNPETQGTYEYTGLALAPSHMSDIPGLLELKELAQNFAGLTSEEEQFNSCLVNLYRSGADHVGWHTDNEKLYDANPTIASLSLGTRRSFILRNKTDHATKYKFLLGDGDLLVMKGTVQQYWQHCIVKMTGKKAAEIGPRINLTFRRVKNPGAAGEVHNNSKQLS
ncbi:hypothetical protein CEUSTIGMA_g9956.t1 [Chlamydomonas eustigma]|uniref:Fe2OG dioxygenase domain-containing protein n=1 Tax=Chlamydomonas eustigma TaxID=1157962 RepID=A0A250XHY6_9CHLO|nr:hypothetical protein CEUSTIGMA_g9956.t1 [Chlamydomonas eustigma]|eukprot:GAX82529.1 hypothetical protein CEUSTIGMA_g9956.t1 [Chlamydomonas eustigma]